MKNSKLLLIAAVSTASILLASCGTDSSADTATASSSATVTSEAHDHDGHEAEGSSTAVEVSSPQARIVTTYDGGIITLDANTMKNKDTASLGSPSPG